PFAVRRAVSCPWARCRCANCAGGTPSSDGWPFAGSPLSSCPSTSFVPVCSSELCSCGGIYDCSRSHSIVCTFFGNYLGGRLFDFLGRNILDYKHWRAAISDEVRDDAAIAPFPVTRRAVRAKDDQVGFIAAHELVQTFGYIIT